MSHVGGFWLFAGLWLLIFFSSKSFLAQTVVRPELAEHAAHSDFLKRGIVVEQTYAPNRGVQKGDVLLTWSRQGACGSLDSPLEFLRIAYQAKSRVTLHGMRNGKKRIWALHSWDSTTETRPNLSGAPLARYLAGQELAREGKIKEAVDHWQSLSTDLGVPWLHAWLTRQAALRWVSAQQWNAADQAYAEAIRTLDSSDRLAAAAWTLEWAHMLFRRGDLDAADSKYTEALGKSLAQEQRAVIRTEESYTLEALSLIALANLANRRGHLQQARDFLRRAYNAEVNTGFNGVNSLLATAAIELSRGNLIQAEAAERTALRNARGEYAAVERLLALHGLGVIAHQRGDLSTALRLIHESLALAERVMPGSGETAMLFEACGTTAREYGRFEEAKDYFLKALQIERRLASAGSGEARDLNHLGVLFKVDGNLEKAKEYLQQAVIMGLKAHPDTRYMAWAEYDLGDVLRKLGDFDGAEEHLRRAIVILDKFVGTTDHADALAALAATKRSKGQLEEVAAFYAQALDDLDSQAAHLGGSSEVRAGFRAKHENYYREYIDLLLSQNKPDLAFDVLERSRARTLLETLAAAHVDVSRGADPQLVAKERRLQADIKAGSERRISLLSTKQSDEQIKGVEKDIGDLTSEYQDIESLIRSTSPDYSALTQPRPLSSKEIQQQLLDSDTMLLEYSLGEERSFVFVVMPDSLHAVELPKRVQIEQAARRAYKLLTGGNRGSAAATRAQKRARVQSEHSFQQSLEELSRMVLAPVAPQLGRKRLLIVADGALHYVPFQALPELQDPANPEAQAAAPLVVNHEIINLPSASVLAVLRQQQMSRAPAPKAVAVLADPVFAKDDPRLLHHRGSNASAPATPSLKFGRSHDDLLDSSFSAGVLTRSAAEVGLTRGDRLELPRLRFSRQEANAILAVTPPGLGLKAVDFRASRATATSPELSQYRIVHFATHGLLNSEHPELSGLLLSLVDAKGKPQEGFLELQDIYNLNLHADLVVLSACETGLGKEISGEGLVGMTRGFMYAGASRVVASLWKVSDAATAQLMAEFYRAMEKDGLAPAAALRHAQIEMWKQKRWNSPYFWAAFQIQGEWK